MSTHSVLSLTFNQLRDAVVGPAAALRLVQRLQPAGGLGDKVFPPTYAGAVYAVEQRRLGKDTIDVVLLDSVQSQANRLELALQQAYDD
jgi:CRISPR-associated protein Csb1